MTTEEYSVYSDFNLEQHKKKYPGYLEVMIEPDGTIKYAIPSHTVFAERAAMQKLNCSFKELCKKVPVYGFYIEELLTITGLMSVWDDQVIVGKDGPTAAQLRALRKLKLNGVYRGTIPTQKRKEELPWR